jgi:hypothetical protein
MYSIYPAKTKNRISVAFFLTVVRRTSKELDRGFNRFPILTLRTSEVALESAVIVSANAPTHACHIVQASVSVPALVAGPSASMVHTGVASGRSSFRLALTDSRDRSNGEKNRDDDESFGEHSRESLGYRYVYETQYYRM